MQIKIYRTVVHEISHNSLPGTVTSDDFQMRVFCGKDIIEIKELQMEGRKKMETSDFLRGFNFKEGTSLL